MTRVWEVTFRQDYGSANVFDRVNVTARTATDAIKKAEKASAVLVREAGLVPTAVTLLAEAK